MQPNDSTHWLCVPGDETRTFESHHSSGRNTIVKHIAYLTCCVHTWPKFIVLRFFPNMLHLMTIYAGWYFCFFVAKTNKIPYFSTTRNNLDFILKTRHRIIDSMYKLIVATNPKEAFYRSYELGVLFKQQDLLEYSTITWLLEGLTLFAVLV